MARRTKIGSAAYYWLYLLGTESPAHAIVRSEARAPGGFRASMRPEARGVVKSLGDQGFCYSARPEGLWGRQAGDYEPIRSSAKEAHEVVKSLFSPIKRLAW